MKGIWSDIMIRTDKGRAFVGSTAKTIETINLILSEHQKHSIIFNALTIIAIHISTYTHTHTHTHTH